MRAPDDRGGIGGLGVSCREGSGIGLRYLWGCDLMTAKNKLQPSLMAGAGSAVFSLLLLSLTYYALVRP